jgi:hypothetical protein
MRKGFTLRCKSDLESNYFWEALGFIKYGVWEKGKIIYVGNTGFKASDNMNLWMIDLNNTLSLVDILIPINIELYE